MELVIRSNNSDRELVFSNLEGHPGDEYFQVEIRGFELRAKTRVYAYGTDAGSLNEIFQRLGQLDRPWSDAKTWNSLEGEFSLAITCDKLGHVRFKITIQTVDSRGPAEEVYVAAGLTLDLGALPSIAKDAQKFFARG